MGWAMGVAFEAIERCRTFKQLTRSGLPRITDAYAIPILPSVIHGKPRAGNKTDRVVLQHQTKTLFTQKLLQHHVRRSMVAEALASQRRVGRTGNRRAVLADHTRLIGVVKVGPSRPGLDGSRSETVRINLTVGVGGGC